MPGYLAYIIPVDAGARPEHPIAPGGSPPGIWGGGNVPMPTPPIHLPGTPPGIWGPTDPRPTPPIVIPPVTPGGPPLLIWGPPGPWPTPPIVIPMPPDTPVGIWGGGNVPMPTPPIVIPPNGGEPIKLTIEQWIKVQDFLTGNLPPPPARPTPAPVKA